MSFGLPSVKPKPVGTSRLPVKEGHYGIPDPMVFGLGANTREKLAPVHPLEESEKLYAENRHQMSMQMLRNAQGIHAPLRIGMELNAARRVGHLPILTSSGLMADVITGRDDEIGFEDILNTPEFREQMGHPHIMCERYFDSGKLQM
ncbi:proteasome maturation protein [Anabrus simplex]|uniref:proteasome maturation protein n=1 Tax=Anabrus simplex TaxID=316456 RepID=UPI0034DD7B96